MEFIINNWQNILIGWVVLSVPASLFLANVIRVGTGKS